MLTPMAEFERKSAIMVHVTAITRTKTGTNRPIDEGAGDSPAPLINDN